MDRHGERALARQLVNGEPGAFDRFVDYFRSKIFNYSWLMCGQREDAEEVAQEALMRVFAKIPELRDPDRVRPWIFRIAKNACLTMRRRSIFAPSSGQEVSLDSLMPSKNGQDGAVRIEIADWSRLPEDQVLQAEMHKELRQAIRDLPDLYRPVILLRDMEELSTEETAEILDVSEDVVKTRLHRARLMLRRQLDATLRVHEEK